MTKARRLRCPGDDKAGEVALAGWQGRECAGYEPRERRIGNTFVIQDWQPLFLSS
jgi:hypothetical protein